MYTGLPIFKSLKLDIDFTANPKSAIFGIPFLDKKILEDFMSLCIIEFLFNSYSPDKIP